MTANATLRKQKSIPGLLGDGKMSPTIHAIPGSDAVLMQSAILGRATRWAASLGANLRAISAAPYSQLLVASDFAGWSLDEDARELISLARSVGIPSYLAYRPLRSLPQCVHYTSFFSLAEPRVFEGRHRISFDYYHGKPDQDPAFERVFDLLRRHADRVARVRLSCSGMLPVALGAGISAEKIHLIPIAVNLNYFRPAENALRRERRQAFGLPQSAVVVGSFQKDGQGWGDGLEPKWVKGPDVFLRTMRQLRERVPELFVLLTGPARGYVKAGLAKEGIPFKHFEVANFHELGRFYQALDCYVVASREEGGPKAVLESMASGIPIISTKVGQAADLIVHEKNGLLANVEDAESLARMAERTIRETEFRSNLVREGLLTAAGNTFQAQRPLWQKYFSGFVNFAGT